MVIFNNKNDNNSNYLSMTHLKGQHSSLMTINNDIHLNLAKKKRQEHLQNFDNFPKKKHKLNCTNTQINIKTPLVGLFETTTNKYNPSQDTDISGAKYKNKDLVHLKQLGNPGLQIDLQTNNLIIKVDQRLNKNKEVKDLQIEYEEEDLSPDQDDIPMTFFNKIEEMKNTNWNHKAGLFQLN